MLMSSARAFTAWTGILGTLTEWAIRIQHLRRPSSNDGDASETLNRPILHYGQD